MEKLYNGDCVEVMAGFEPDSVDAIVCDPPYLIAFMGRSWDTMQEGPAQQEWHRRWCEQALRVLKPGGYLLAFGGTRTYHRLACAAEDAGFEIRDSIASLHWVHAQGFPKSLDISKAIDNAAGAEREVVGSKFGQPGYRRGPTGENNVYGTGLANGDASCKITAPATDAAREWSGWGTALKPAHEPIVVARKPFAGTVADNVLKYGTGGMNVDGCRVKTGEELRRAVAGWQTEYVGGDSRAVNAFELHPEPLAGRWPPNVLLHHLPACGEECASGCVVKELDGQSGVTTSNSGTPFNRNNISTGSTPMFHSSAKDVSFYGDSGGASRMFPQFDQRIEADDPYLVAVGFGYHAKPSTDERDSGTASLARGRQDPSRDPDSAGANDPRNRGGTLRGNVHPTVKPISAMRWLCRLVCRRGGTVLDPFLGSGTTGIAALQEDMHFIGIEREPEYFAIAQARIRWWAGRHQLSMF
jgi:hypothetical protein